MKTASIFKRPGKGYIVFGSSRTVSGFTIASGPYFSIQENETNADIIINAIKSSLCNDDSKRVPDPTNWKEDGKIFLQNIGLKSLKELENPTTKYVSISEDEGKIMFTPTRPAQKTGKGFLHKNENDAVTVSFTASNQEIATAYELALSRCE